MSSSYRTEQLPRDISTACTLATQASSNIDEYCDQSSQRVSSRPATRGNQISIDDSYDSLRSQQLSQRSQRDSKNFTRPITKICRVGDDFLSEADYQLEQIAQQIAGMKPNTALLAQRMTTQNKSFFEQRNRRHMQSQQRSLQSNQQYNLKFICEKP